VIFRDDVYLVPRLSGECLFGATVEEGVSDRDVTFEGLRWLLEEALLTAPGLAGLRFLRAWAGLRPATGDGMPAVGPWPGISGLLVATGHYRNGILMTPVTAQIIREHAVDGRSTLEAAAALLPDRLLSRR
jgi:glycine oxidase